MLETRRDGPVSVLELNRPDRRNALDLTQCRAIAQAAGEEVQAGARVLVVTGRGSSFCSGADLGGVYGAEFLEALYTMLHGLTRLPVPIIAAINGPAIGAGTQLALACDLRVAHESATFAVPTAKNGMAVDAWTIRALAASAGRGVARRLMLAAESIDRDEALACGLVDRVGGVEEAVAWGHEIGRLAPLTLAHNKSILTEAIDTAQTAEIDASFAACWASADVEEAATARAEKRAPRFTGE